MDHTNFVVAERATIDHFSLDRIMSAIVKAFETTEAPSALGVVERVLGKLSITQYTYEGLGGTQKAIVNDGRRHSMIEVLEIDDDLWSEFLDFQQSIARTISWEQRAALFWSQQLPDCCLVSESEQVLDFAEELGVNIMTIGEMQEAFFADMEPDAALVSQPPSSVIAPFDPRIDAEKVEAAFSDGLEGDLAVLKQKSYWVVVCVLFEWAGWIKKRKRADFCQWVNAHFHFDKPINAEIDLKSAINNINVKEHNLDRWPNNPYRDLAYLLRDMFFGERQGQPGGFYVYAREKDYLKPGKMWRRQDR